ncbi:hypothetical protein PM082_000752 [Marasmius tenuissimus]|nr:hypothetical protein PM082_000752 [Marasmius tenuissimus]
MESRTQSWSFTVIRSKNLHLLRPERTWRPIICISVDSRDRPRKGQGEDEREGGETYETILGLDGQNPNQKEVFVFGPTVSRTTRFSIQVYYQPPGKKKVKRTKRVPVACCSSVLGDVLAKQDAHKEKKHAQLRLQPQSTSKRGKKKNDADCDPAILYVKVRAPAFVKSSQEVFSEDDYASSHHPESITDHEGLSEPPSSPIESPVLTDVTNVKKRRTKATGIDPHLNAEDQSPRRRIKKRKPIKGFNIYSDDDVGMMSVTCSEFEESDADVGGRNDGYDSTLDKGIDWGLDEDDDEGDVTLSPEQEKTEERRSWPWIPRVSWISGMLDPAIIPMYSTGPSQQGGQGSGPTISFHPPPPSSSPEPDDTLTTPPILLTASPEPEFAQLKPFPTTASDLERGDSESENPDPWLEWLWYKTELLLCSFTVYGELCCAARSLDALAEYSKLHHGSMSDSSPSLLQGSISGRGEMRANTRSNSFSSFRSWGSARPTLVDGDVENGVFRGTTSLGNRFGDSLAVSSPDGGGGGGVYPTSHFERLEREARERVEKVYTRLQMEWTYVAGLLAALAAVDTAVLAITPDSLFGINSSARPLVATSSVCSGCGIVCVVWFLWWYGWASGVGVSQGGVGGGLGGVDGFMSRALDINKTYVSFALTSRIPACLMFFSALTLMGFLSVVAYDAAPFIVWIVCSGVVVGMGGQFVVWGIVRAVRGIFWGVRGVGRGVRCCLRVVVGRVKGMRDVNNDNENDNNADGRAVEEPVEPPAVADLGRERVVKGYA